MFIEIVPVATLGITTSCEAVGTTPKLQLDALFQLPAPVIFQVFVCATTLKPKKIRKMVVEIFLFLPQIFLNSW